jgi:membrane protein
MIGEGFVRDHLLLRASALTYFTVLSVVPLLAVVVAIASAVGFGKLRRGQIRRSASPSWLRKPSLR